VVDLRSQAGAVVDMAGGHRVDMQGSFTSRDVHVDTDLALIPPGAMVQLVVLAAPKEKDASVTEMTISGLSGLTLTDGTKTGTGTVDLSGWDLSQPKIQLPPGYSRNVPVTFRATASNGRVQAQADVTKLLRMQ